MANSMKIDFELTNLKEFASMLDGFSASMAGRIVEDAVADAIIPIRDAAKAKVPVKTGALRKAITVKTVRYQDNFKVVGMIGIDKHARFLGGRKIVRGGSLLNTDQPSKYAHLVEFGHFRVAGKGVSGKSLKGRTIRKGGIKTKGWVRAQPFLRPATEQAKPAAEMRLAAGIEKGLEREWGRLKSKLKRVRKAA